MGEALAADPEGGIRAAGHESDLDRGWAPDPDRRPVYLEALEVGTRRGVKGPRPDVPECLFGGQAISVHHDPGLGPLSWLPASPRCLPRRSA
jgi:hypothetical protein